MKIFATIKFGEFQKTRDWRPRSGIRPQLKVGDIFTSCVVRGPEDDSPFDSGVEYAVRLELLHWEQYKDKIYVGMPVQLNDGSRIIAHGKIVEIHD